MSHDFLPIEYKEDSQAKADAVAGKPTKNYLFAWEANFMVNCINLLRSMIVLTGHQIDQIIARAYEVPLGEIAADPQTIINESVEGFGLGTEGVTFITFTMAGYRFVLLFKGSPGVYGASGLTLEDTDVELIYSDFTAPQPELLEYYAYVVQDGIGIPQSLVMHNTTGDNLTFFRHADTYGIYSPNALFQMGKFDVQITNINMDIDGSPVVLKNTYAKINPEEPTELGLHNFTNDGVLSSGFALFIRLTFKP